jgi:DNA polymerase-4
VGARTILHVDLDAFYASVEQRDDPALRGRPVVVGGDRRRGVVCAASYEARGFGVRSAMPMAQATSLCPQAVVVRPRMGHYAEVSERFFAILGRWSPLVEALSLDEAFLDVSGEERLFGDGPTIGAAIRKAVREELALTCSVGVAPVKLVAKIASDLCKPDGLLAVPAAEVGSFLDPLPIGRLWGVGEVTERSLRELGIRSFGDVARGGEGLLAARMPRDAASRLVALARGEDDRAVEPERRPVSIGSEDTFDRDLRDRGELGIELLAQADKACARLRALELRARIVVVKVKFADHELVTRRTTLEPATGDGRTVGRTAEKLLAGIDGVERRGVRLTGVTLAGLEPKDAPRQLGFDEAEHRRGEALGETLDRLRSKFGADVLRRAVHVGEKK